VSILKVSQHQYQCLQLILVKSVFIIQLIGLGLILSSCMNASNTRNTKSSLLNVELNKPGRYELTMRHKQRLRHFNVLVPSKYDKAKPTAMVLVLHSGGGSASLIEERTQMSLKAEKENFVVVYPTGSGYTGKRFHTWNSGHCCFYALSRSIDDVGFIQTLVKNLKRKLRIDSSRVYITGFSNGGMLAYRIAAVTPNTFAAIAPISATIGGHADIYADKFVIPKPKHAMPMLVMHGKADQQILYAGGSGTKALYHRRDIGVMESLSHWFAINHCNRDAKISLSRSGNIETKQFVCNVSKGAPMTLVTIKGMGHAWASEIRKGWRIEYALLDEPNREISATDLIWNFFKKHKLKSAQTKTGNQEIAKSSQ